MQKFQKTDPTVLFPIATCRGFSVRNQNSDTQSLLSLIDILLQIVYLNRFTSFSVFKNNRSTPPSATAEPLLIPSTGQQLPPFTCTMTVCYLPTGSSLRYFIGMLTIIQLKIIIPIFHSITLNSNICLQIRDYKYIISRLEAGFLSHIFYG